MTAADGSVTSYLYQGNCTTITDPAGKWKAYTSDAMGNLTLVSEPAPGGGTHQTTYTYNLLNKLIGVSMPRGGVTQTRTFNYDLTTGRLMSATNPENGTVSYTYRADGSLASKTDAKNQQTTYTYDGYGRLTQAASYNPWGQLIPDSSYSYYYDSNPLDATYNPWSGWGRLTAVAWTSSSMGMDFTEMYRYSVGGLMVGKRMQLSPNPDPNKPWPKDAETSNLDSTFTYDNEGQYLGPQGYPNWPQSFSYSTDTLGRPTGITASPLNPGDDPRVVVKDVIYGVAGELQQARIYKEPAPYTYVTTYLKRTWNYNTLFQATRETVVNEEGGTSTTVLDLQYSYTAGQNNGRITQRTEAVSGEQVSYSYDSLNRLIQAVTTGPQYGLSWTYDGFGNMTTQQVTKGSGYNTNLSYNGLTNRITTPGYGYDANGNLTAMPALTMQYDVQNRMVSSTSSSGGTKVYAYGPGGQRVGQSMPPDPNNWQNNSWTIYMYGPDGRRIADCGADYQPADPQYPQQNLSIQSGCGAAYIHFRGTLVRKENLPQFLDGRWQYRWEWPGTTMAVDRLGSVDFSTWGVGSTTSYYPYGEEETPTGNDTQKFATYWRDSATGLDYAQNRYYASQIGRFTTADPYRRSAKRRNPQSWNRYTYVLNDPVNANDPTGLDPMCLVTGVGVTGPDMQGCGYNAMFSVAPDGLPTPSTDPTMNSTAEPGQPTIPVDSSGAPGAPSATVIAPVVPVEPVASPVTGGIIISGSYTDSSLGGLAGFGIGSLFGPEGSAIGLLFGSMIGVGGNLSLVPSTDSWYLGVILTFTPVFFGGTGTALSVVDVPSGQDPNAIANGYSTSVGTQINPWTGYTVVTSPNNGTAQGPQWGTKSPVTVGASYNMCVWNCQP